MLVRSKTIIFALKPFFLRQKRQAAIDVIQAYKWGTNKIILQQVGFSRNAVVRQYRTSKRRR